MSRLVSQ